MGLLYPIENVAPVAGLEPAPGGVEVRCTDPIVLHGQAWVMGENGAGARNRTRDFLLTKQALYRLRYTGVVCGAESRTRTADLPLTKRLLYQLS